jgi:MSHA biogenesis protein MshJ
MKAVWQDSAVVQKYQSLAVREKGLLVAAVVVVLFLLFDLLMFTPQNDRQAVLEASLANEQRALTDLSQQLAVLSLAMNTDPDQAKKDKLKSLLDQRQRLDESLEDMAAGLIPADQLPALLQDVLARLDGVELVSVSTMPVEALMFDDPEVENQTEGLADEVSVDPVGVYKHGVTMTVTGSYFKVLDYLKALEALEWRFYWDLMDYQVATYPSATVELQVYTLSTEIGVLGN